ncbi:Peptidoglycan/xylan/chitin deacetylase, PgdA/CDA1 family [Daejeonella lutea]|uniref:Peptidoglycan/xylan/chitin deacetylase, PgdA/CDA1 family n=2 Tax=Daejeonella lutea TaxID=572036 RepID=A0A1T5DHM2_9SPHI|nr:Peptidoglycan/xylan/chitin deacetylase, PgdA/CDA1 family [Daejeonella lutea]
MAQTKIMLKLDDIGAIDGKFSAPAALDYLKERRIKASLGVIATRLDETSASAFRKYLEAKSSTGETLFEIWNHGYDHSNSIQPGNFQEFKGTSFDFQFKHLEAADLKMKTLLGLQMQTFGAPYNAVDHTTFDVLAKNGKYKVIFFSGSNAPNPGGIVSYNNRVNMEIATGKVDYEHFLKEYDKFAGIYTDYMVLQGHPNLWDESNMAQFRKIIDFLKSENCLFVLPLEYYTSTH